MNSRSLKGFWAGLKRNHVRNRKKGTYRYMLKTALKIILIYLAVMVPIVLIGKYLLDMNGIFNFITDRFPDWMVLSLFLASESLLGMIPPDLFIIWSAKFNSPFLLLSILGLISYAGGAISYYIGFLLRTRKRIKAYFERVLATYIGMVRKWGGAFIIISAIFPFSPFSMVVIAVSLFKYPFRLYLLYGLVRIIRFYIQGIFYLHILNLGTILG
ncbi:MAG: hypothetical protein WAL29_11875 [Bacteroidales bacterium]